MTDKQRAEFCPEFDHNAFCLSINKWKIAQDFRDKWKTYLRFKPFFKRECVLINSITDLEGEAFANFRAQNPVFLMKALDMCCGRGIQKIENTDVEPIRTFVLGVLEPYIQQFSDLSVLHPESVNTLRIPTINYGDHVEIFTRFFVWDVELHLLIMPVLAVSDVMWILKRP